MSDNSNYLANNRKRLIDLLRNIPEASCPPGWEKLQTIAISGFLGFGFSKENPSLVLIVSSSGRSVIDCNTNEKIARDYDEYEGMDELGIYCLGIGPLDGESILLGSESGGGLPLSTNNQEYLSLLSPNWPQHDLIYYSGSGHPLIENHQSSCLMIKRDFIEAVGFSWCGNYLATASSSDFEIWRKIK